MNALESQCFAFFAGADGAKPKEIEELSARIEADVRECEGRIARGETARPLPTLTRREIRAMASGIFWPSEETK